ncbi:MAG: Ig-like domain-containing protein [Erysipelotrichaceae bacterium]|nr:Ig-like domain-containing protein [Erysipelotrichaceae bacterium]
MKHKSVIELLLISIIGFLMISFIKSLFVTVNDSLLHNVEIYIGQTYQMDEGNVVYQCNQNDLIKIDNNTFTGLSAGKATVKVSVKGSLLYKTFDIVIKEHPYIIDASPSQLQVHSSFTLSATDTITSQKANDIQWISSDESIATVDENGVVTGIKSGDVQISLKHHDIVDSVKNIKVLDQVIHVSNIIIKSSTNITLNPNHTSQIVCQLSPTNVTDNNLNYTIDDTTIANVDSNGLITAKKIGTTTITITSNDLNASSQIQLTVEKKPITGNQLTTSKLQDAHINEATKLMIVAHPDDETLWGGGHLSEDNWFVVCITNGDNETRKSEFYKALEVLGANGVILSYPDKVNGQRSDWENDKSDIMKDLDFVIRYKDWDQITTHNQDGEYGHIHHKMTHSLVTSLTKNAGQLNKLYYFGKYYSKNKIPSSLKENMSTYAIKKKEEAYDIYTSQSKVIQKMNQMTPYEHWTKAIN